eukprot:scaffold35321_cov37-Prasinocladus_malaysianus.AAC.2
MGTTPRCSACIRLRVASCSGSNQPDSTRHNKSSVEIMSKEGASGNASGTAPSDRARYSFLRPWRLHEGAKGGLDGVEPRVSKATVQQEPSVRGL